ncbi:MAG: pantoate--beta-alanine ligase [Thermoleophilia bacterium]|nr:pantoate--beta-alanine ligase [Thermoleophilia bacterium]
MATTIDEVRGRVALHRRRHEGAVGLVPTMGSFHEGHLSLMRAARAETEFVAVSIFVNPAQFGAVEDFDSYPRDTGGDLALAAGEGVDLFFITDSGEMYPAGHESTISTGSVAEGLCGQARPGHFSGVATVVAKLLNIVGPDSVFLGQKDAQQVAVIRRMVKDLDFDVEIRVCPTVREPGGLAMSSRNAYLSPEEKDQARALYLALREAREQVAAGETGAARIRRQMRRAIAANYLVELEYAKIVDPETMQPVQEITGEVLAAVAAKVGPARLIDNMILSP